MNELQQKKAKDLEDRVDDLYWLYAEFVTETATFKQFCADLIDYIEDDRIDFYYINGCATLLRQLCIIDSECYLSLMDIINEVFELHNET